MTTPLALRPLAVEDVRPLARLHRSAFPSFFLSSLGEPFLVQFYRAFLTDDTAVTVVARSAGEDILGAVVGTTEPAGFFTRLLRRRWPGFVAASARAVLTNPRATPRLLRAVRYRGDTSPHGDGALLSSICVDPAHQGEGLGRQMIEAWTREAARKGAASAALTTDADDNDAVNQFYRARGWVLADRYTTREGRAMNHYTIALDGSR
jgi:ribosomal protein S18 acetylase RimI-like enzyme